MSVDIQWLKKKGVSSGANRKRFTAEIADLPKRTKKLIELASNRMRTGRTLNLSEWRAFAAIDLAYEVPFSQTTPTLVNNILSQKLDEKGTKEALANWGLSEDSLFLKVPKPEGGFRLQLNPPVFFQIYIPIVKAYHTAVLARIFNERNADPWMPYKPLKQTTNNEISCEIITDMVNVQSGWFGYPAVGRQAISQALKYGLMIAFPKEEWYCERHIRDDGSENGEKFIEKEGLRYNLPHPTRMGFDLNHPLTSLNTDTGCEWAFNWDVCRYSDILDNPKYWNRSKIFCGTNWFADKLAGNYFTEIFPCQVTSLPERWGGAFNQTMTRDDKMAYYNVASDRDQAVFLTQYYQKLIPADWELGDYKYPVWHHFTIASDDTVIWCAPCAYNPLWFMGYDYDENAGRNSSLALELIPWQDHLGNILSQMLLTAKQNLANVTFYDKNLVNDDDVKALQNKGEAFYRGMHFLGYDSMKQQRAGLNVANAFHPVQLTKGSIIELLQIMPVVLSLMERVLGISSQDAGSSASHQQSKAEVIQTGDASSNRRRLTASYVDEGLDAWGRQIYTADMAYFNPEILAQVSADIPDLEKHLEELGFKIENAGKDKVLVKGHKKGLRLEGFAARNSGPDPTREKELAQVIFQTVSIIANQPALFQEVGGKNVLLLIEHGARLAGGPRDIKKFLAADPNAAGGGVDPKVIALLKQVQQSMMEAIKTNVVAPAAQQTAQLQQEIVALQQQVKSFEPVIKAAAQAQNAQVIEQQKAASKMQIDQAEFQAEQQRKNLELQANLERDAKAADADLAIKAREAQLQLEADKAAAALELQTTAQKAQLDLSVQQAKGAAAVKQAEAKAQKAKSGTSKK